MIRSFCEEHGILFQADYPLSEHTTFRIGGNADLAVFPENAQQVSLLVKEFCARKTPYFVLGRGSDLLADDAGYRGVLLVTERMKHISRNGNTLTAGAGCSLASLSNAAADAGLSGMEFLHGIPGSVGGGVFMNAGAYGGEIGAVVASVTWVDCATGQIRTAERGDLIFEYRHTTFSDFPSVICEATFVCPEGDPKIIRDTMRELDSKRREKQPLEYPSAGSAFKRPTGYFAGKLIEDAGLKGLRVGDAAVSEKHAGFIVNYGNATANQVKELIRKVTQTVYEMSGVRLEPEIRFLDAE